jgi:hypothetical protein
MTHPITLPSPSLWAITLLRGDDRVGVLVAGRPASCHRELADALELAEPELSLLPASDFALNVDQGRS